MKIAKEMEKKQNKTIVMYEADFGIVTILPIGYSNSNYAIYAFERERVK